MKAKNKTNKKLVKVTYSVGDYIVFKTIFGFNEGVVVEVIDESAVSVNTIDGFDNYYVPVRDIEFKTAHESIYKL